VTPRRAGSDPGDENACYDVAIRLLNHRWRSRAELAKRLSEKKFDTADVRTALRRVESEGWIDDERFARELVRARSGKLGPHRLRLALRKAGVDDDVIRKVLDDLSGDAATEGLRQACESKIRSLAQRYGNDYVKSEVGRGKLARHLLGRGYDGWSIRNEMDRQLHEIRTEDEND